MGIRQIAITPAAGPTYPFGLATIPGKLLLAWESHRDEPANLSGVFGSPVVWTAASDDVHCTGDHGRWWKATADGSTIFPVTSNAQFTLYETDFDAAGSTITPQGETTNANADDLSLGAVSGPAAGQVILYGAVYDTAFNGTLLATPGAGWSIDRNVNGNGLTSGASDQHPHHLAMRWDGTTTPLVGEATIAFAQPYGGAMLQIDGPDCPDASFVAVPRFGGAPLEVTFTDTTTGGGTSWLWDFGDGDTSTEQNPVHVFVAEGTYDVTLTVSKAGCDDSEVIRVGYVSVLVECRPLLFEIYRPGVGVDADTLFATGVTLCDSFDQWIVVEELGAGTGGLTINRYSDDATAAVLGDGAADIRLAKVYIPDVQAEPIFAVWLETGDFTLLSSQEKGGEDLQFTGRGALAYIDRGTMAPRAFLTAPYALADPVDGVWRFERPDFSSSLGFLASDANGTGSLVSSWQLPAVSDPDDDVLLLAFVQIRGPETVTLAAGWTERASQDTSGLTPELRYILADKVIGTAAPPYQDTFTSGAPARWTAAQLAFRSTGAPTGEFGENSQAESTPEGTISVTLSGSPTAGNVLIAYATETSDGPGVVSYVFPEGWTILQRIPNANNYTGYAAVAYKLADGTETDVDVTIAISGGSNLTTTSLLVAEYPILYAPLKAGEILYLVLAELQAAGRPVNPVPLMTLDFTYELDSNGDPWDETPATAQFTARVTENVYDVVNRLIDTGALVLVMDPDLTLHAYNRSTYGRDLTGGAFGAGVVRLEAGVNIASELKRLRQIPRAATHAWAVGGEDTFALESLADAASRVTREVGVLAPDTTDAAALAGIGDDELAGRLERSERLSLGLALPSTIDEVDDTTGAYLPGPDGSNGHVWTGDTLSLDTGTDDFDYEDEPFRVAAIGIKEPTGQDAAALRATDLDVTLRLGSNMDPRTDVGSGSPGSSSGGVGGSGGGVITNLGSYQLRSEKGLPDGYASIDTDGHVPPSELGSGAVGDGELGLRDDGTWGPVTPPVDTPVVHGSMGATETLDISAGTWHTGTLNADCTITVSGFAVSEGLVALFRVTQDGTGGWAITWDTDVVFAGDDQPGQTAGDVTWYALWSDAGDSVIYGAKIGGSAVSALDDLTDVTITAPAEDNTLRYVGGVWVNDNRRWEPVTFNFGTGPELVWDGDDLVMEWKEH